MAMRRAGGVPIRLRFYRPEDRPTLARIMTSTAMRGRPAREFYEDEAVVRRIFFDYYVDREPECCLVAEVDGQIVGYVLGCRRTARYERYLMVHLGPWLFARVVGSLVGLRYRRAATYRSLWWVVARAWREVPPVSLKRYPAHVHVGLEPGLRTRQPRLLWYACWARLAEALEPLMRSKGVRGIHGHTAEPVGQEFFATRLKLFGWQAAGTRPFSLFARVAGQRWRMTLMTHDCARKAPRLEDLLG